MKGGIIIKFKSRIKYRRKWIKIKRKLYILLFKPVVYVELYREILNQFTNGEESVRYYMNSYAAPERSIKHKLEKYNADCDTDFNVRYLRGNYFFIEEYIKDKFSIYSDVEFVYGEGDDGLYFEIRLK